MLELKHFAERREDIIAGLKTRNFGDQAESLVQRVIDLNEERKTNQVELDELLAERNRTSKQIGIHFRNGEKEAAEELKGFVEGINGRIETLEKESKNIENALRAALYEIPNIPHHSVPPGNSDEDNEIFKQGAVPLPDLGDDALPHWELASRYGLIDFELGAKITGSGFPLFQGKGSQLKRALVNFFLAEASKAGYLEVYPPFLVNEATATATGQLPDKEGQMYYVQEDDLYLIPTAEVPITNIYRDVIVSQEDLPLKMAGFTPCFRREAGSYGAHVKGLNRVHQFDKVEIVHIAHPDESYAELEKMLAHVESLLTKLELPYRILRLCGGDLSFTSALTFDFEVYSAAQKRWLEVSSVSNFETFQSNRLKCRFKNEKGKNQLVHTLNGSALALARIVACLLENNQSEDGVKIPDALVNYTGFERIN